MASSAGRSKSETAKLMGEIPNVAIKFQIGKSDPENFIVQLFDNKDHFFELLNNQVYKGSRIEKYGGNMVKNNLMIKGAVNNNKPPEIHPGSVQGNLAKGAGVVFLTAEASMIITSSETKEEECNEFAREHEAIGRIVKENSDINGHVTHRILKALKSTPPSPVSIISCCRVNQKPRK